MFVFFFFLQPRSLKSHVNQVREYLFSRVRRDGANQDFLTWLRDVLFNESNRMCVMKADFFSCSHWKTRALLHHQAGEDVTFYPQRSCWRRWSDSGSPRPSPSSPGWGAQWTCSSWKRYLTQNISITAKTSIYLELANNDSRSNKV